MRKGYTPAKSFCRDKTGAADDSWSSGMGCKNEHGNRNWGRDNRAEGEFEDILEQFPTKERVLEEIRGINDGKVGAPFRAPDCVIRWCMKQIAGRGMGYRAAARKASRKLREYGLPGISYSALNKRKNTLDIHDGTVDVTDARVMAYGTGAKPRPGPITVAVDSTGLSPDRPSGWRVYHWDQKSVRGWYKLHAAVDVDTGEILAYAVTEPYVGDSLMFRRLMETVLSAGHEVTCVLADAAYDKKEYWDWMRSMKIDFIANIGKNLNQNRRGATTGRNRGCYVRARHVRRILEIGNEKWKEEVGYSRRWKVEAAFSDLKRKFGDTLRARARESIADMIGWFVIVYNLFKEVRWSL